MHSMAAPLTFFVIFTPDEVNVIISLSVSLAGTPEPVQVQVTAISTLLTVLKVRSLEAGTVCHHTLSVDDDQSKLPRTLNAQSKITPTKAQMKKTSSSTMLSRIIVIRSFNVIPSTTLERGIPHKWVLFFSSFPLIVECLGIGGSRVSGVQHWCPAPLTLTHQRVVPLVQRE